MRSRRNSRWPHATAALSRKRFETEWTLTAPKNKLNPSGRRMTLADLPTGRADFLAALAEEVWHEFSGERLVFLSGIAEENEITISYGNYDQAFDGLLEQKGGKFHIYCNIARCEHQNAPRA